MAKETMRAETRIPPKKGSLPLAGTKKCRRIPPRKMINSEESEREPWEKSSESKLQFASERHYLVRTEQGKNTHSTQPRPSGRGHPTEVEGGPRNSGATE